VTWGNGRTRKKKDSVSVSLYPTWSDLELNTGLRGEKPAANRLRQ